MERLFQFAVIKHPTEEEKNQGKRSVIIVSPGDWMLCRNEQEVVMHATRHIPEAEMEFANRLEVAVRPF